MKWIKRLAILLIVLVIGIVTLIYFSLNEAIPKAKEGSAADVLAQKMLKAINKEAWDTTGVIQWTFDEMHDFLWDKNRHFCQVKWEDHEVLLDINKRKGRVWKGQTEFHGAKAQKIVKEAWEYWCNDSFWLNAPSKVFDPGTSRAIVESETGDNALLVRYTSGGVTPGDAYLWILDEQGLPISWKMWVSIIPIGGLSFSWEQWKETSTGAKIAEIHKNLMLDLSITNIKAATDLKSFGLEKDPFQSILEL